MLLFIDESGTDHKGTPYEVLAGVAVESRNLWKLIQSVRALERETFGVTLADAGIEFKGKKLLKRKVFRFASQDGPIPTDERTSLCRSFIEKGQLEAQGSTAQRISRREFTAYGQSCLDFVSGVLALCSQHGVSVLASIVASDAPRPADPSLLRRDYMILFRRFAHCVKQAGEDRTGLVVFDERDKTLSRILCQQMSKYFLATQEGRRLSACIVPEPLFVHSDLTTAVRLADIVGYILNWGYRPSTRTTRPRRDEIRPYAQTVFDLRYQGHSKMVDGSSRTLQGITYFDDLTRGLPEGDAA